MAFITTLVDVLHEWRIPPIGCIGRDEIRENPGFDKDPLVNDT
ncbi:MAG: hypothetical protein ACREUM_07355 [Nitrosospira sp.]